MKKAPNVAEMKLGDVQKLVDELVASVNKPLPPVKKAKSGEWLWRVGATYHIRTVSYHYSGVFVGFNGPNNSEVVLEAAAWIADDGRFTQAIADGTLSEVEPYPDGTMVGINRTAIVDFCEVEWTSPRSQK
jgi:hypothetical protein